MIYWSEFSWEAFATLATGFAAVGGAICVSRKQAQILSRQTTIQEATLRFEIFDRRYKLYECTKSFVFSVVRGDDHNQQPIRRFIDSQEATNFKVALGESQFLFGQEISNELKSIWKNACDLHRWNSEKESSYAATQSYGQANIDNAHRLEIWFVERYSSISELFRSELEIGFR